MNVYDFDQTIYYPDSVISFALWEASRHPGIVIPYIGKTVYSLLKWKSGSIKRYKFERQLNRIFSIIPNVQEEIEQYWDTHMDHFSEWFLKQKKPDDLIISASPECFLKPIAERLNVRLIATKYDIELGVVIGNINLGKEKARYIIESGMPMIEGFYSDSLSDAPLALLAERAFIVKNKAKTVVPWPEMDEKTVKEIKRKTDIGESYEYQGFNNKSQK